jgi:hypothetical protein
MSSPRGPFRHLYSQVGTIEAHLHSPLCIGSLVGSLVISAAPLGAQDLRIVADSVLSGSRVEAHVGDRIDLQIVADLGAISTTGLSLHLSVPDSLFEVVDAKPAAPGVTPFTPGSLFSGFALRNTVLPESDPVAAATPGWQLDYAVVLAPGPGAPITGTGVVATFSLRCLAPTEGARIVFNDSPVRETRLLVAGSVEESRFRALHCIDIRVTGSLVAVQPSGWAGIKRTTSIFGAARR